MDFSDGSQSVNWQVSKHAISQGVSSIIRDRLQSHTEGSDQNPLIFRRVSKERKIKYKFKDLEKKGLICFSAVKSKK